MEIEVRNGYGETIGFMRLTEEETAFADQVPLKEWDSFSFRIKREVKTKYGFNSWAIRILEMEFSNAHTRTVNATPYVIVKWKQAQKLVRAGVLSKVGLA